ncbi:hypothetical protein ACHQM5_006813 [Ranunculus cassubicifolius]
MSSPSSHNVSALSNLLHSPFPYLFGGIAVIVGLIVLSLLILACTNHKSSAGSESDDIEKAMRLSLPPPEMEPKILVIMAGHNTPTFLAKPVSTAQHR